MDRSITRAEAVAVFAQFLGHHHAVLLEQGFQGRYTIVVPSVDPGKGIPFASGSVLRWSAHWSLVLGHGSLPVRPNFPPGPLSDAVSGGYDGRFVSLWEFAMRHVLSALVQNVPGVLSHISGMLASRGYNIDSLAVGETEDPHLSRMTFVVVGDDSVLEQVRKQLEKIVTVVRVDDISVAGPRRARPDADQGVDRQRHAGARSAS